jgi:hypothetical protein
LQANTVPGMSIESIWDNLADSKIKPFLIEKGLSEPDADETAVEICGMTMNMLQDHLELG